MVVCNLHQKWACFNIYIESEYFKTFPIFIDLMQKKKRERDGYEMYKCEFMQMYKSICILQWSELFFQCCFCGCSIFYWRRKRTWTTWVLLFTRKFQQKKSTTASDQLPKTQILDFMDTIKWVWSFPKAWCSTFFCNEYNWICHKCNIIQLANAPSTSCIRWNPCIEWLLQAIFMMALVWIFLTRAAM